MWIIIKLGVFFVSKTRPLGNIFNRPACSFLCKCTVRRTNRPNLFFFFTDIDFPLFMCFSIIVSSSCSRYTCAQGMKKRFDYDPLIQQ